MIVTAAPAAISGLQHSGRVKCRVLVEGWLHLLSRIRVPKGGSRVGVKSGLGCIGLVRGGIVCAASILIGYTR